ncbi:DNA adenine methylase [Nocardioides sp. MH1]|uniref:DNA adenine methylase n=1 Tax=Nocardioides sp. MH1 TaxID=3242490 RepID=UPI003521D1AF
MTGTVRVVAARRYGTLSPLRYPGGKAALAGLFADVIGELGVRNCTYVEPYAGGAGAGIALLREGLVSRLVINDIDPAVHAFWHSVVNHNAAFVDWVMEVPLTIEEWRSQRGVYRSKPADLDQLGRAFFYLNRTNRSGVLNAGVIGGQDQGGRYKIDARFNRSTLAGRICALSEFAGAIEVTALDGRTVIERHRRRRTSFLYIDPPYVHAGSQLYLNAFDGRDHQALAEAVNRINGAHWLMTYDESPFIQRLYGKHFQAALDLNYSARYPGKASELVVASEQVGRVLTESSEACRASAGA